ncbi:MAG: integrase core domain-containing protein, partial [bacterium]
PECKSGLTRYFRFYNTERRHQSLENKTPWEVYATGMNWKCDDGRNALMMSTLGRA